MIRKLALLCSAALALSVVAVGVAGASSTPPTGALNCGTTGTVTLKKGIPDSSQPASTKNISVKIHKAAIDTCDASGVTGGKATITGGTAQLNAKIPPGANCSTLLSSPPNIVKPVLVVKLTNTTGTKTETVAVIKPTNLQFSQSGTGFHVTGTIPQTKANNKPFGGETFEAQLNVDNLSDAAACIGGTAPLDHIDFSTAGGSGISIHA